MFLLNQCPPAQQSARIDEGVAALEAMGGLLSPMVLARVDYQEAARLGWGVTEFNPRRRGGRRDARAVGVAEAAPGEGGQTRAARKAA